MADRSSYDRVRRWKSRLTILVAAFLLFETVSGLAIWLLPFSVPVQMTVLVHTVGGVLLLVPYGYYQIRHWLTYRHRPLDWIKLTGYLSMGATSLALVSGGVLTYQALFTRAIGESWDLLHLGSTFAVVGAATPHLLGPIVRYLDAPRRGVMGQIIRAEKWFGWNAVFHAFLGAAGVLLIAFAYSQAPQHRTLPASYDLPYGTDSTFAPSLAVTESGKPLQPGVLGGSKSCGQSGCHKQIYEEWAPSAHRYAAMDPAFRGIQKRMARLKSPPSTRYCGGCHDPVSLLSGSKSMLHEDMTNTTGYHEGISCMSCHAVEKIDVKGNADYVIDPPQRYVGERDSGVVARTVSNFLIRAYPDHHNASLDRTLYKTPEFCGSCHKQFIDEKVNDVGWVQLQNQYDNWRKSRWNHPDEPKRTIQCRECHMPLVDSFDPASGDPSDYNRSPEDEKHRSHRFLAANQFVPSMLDLPGAEEQVRLTEKWLKGELEIPEIDEKWTDGPVVPLEIIAPDSAAPGSEVEVTVRLTNNKAGHNFPTGPLDLIQAWVRIAAVSPAGDTLFTSGRLTDRHFIEPGSFVFKAEPVDRFGNLVDFHNLWEMVGSNFSRALYPGFSDRARYRIPMPETALAGADESPREDASPPVRPASLEDRSEEDGPVRIDAELAYRKFNQSFYNAILADSTDLETAPVTVISSDRHAIHLAPIDHDSATAPF